MSIVFCAGRGCGGYGDRLIGFASAYVLARALDKPFGLMLEPEYVALFDHLECTPIDTLINLINKHMAFETDDFSTYVGNVGVSMNMPCVRGLWNNPRFTPPYTFESAFTEAFTHIYTTYLRPLPHLYPKIAYAAGLQIRCGDVYCMPHAYAEEYIPESAVPSLLSQCKHYLMSQGVQGRVFVTSDARMVYEHAAALSDNTLEFCFFPRSDDIHSDFHNSSGRAEEIVQEHVHLSTCPWIITSLRSNFGSTAAYAGKCKHLVYFSATWNNLLVSFRHINTQTTLCIKEHDNSSVPSIKPAYDVVYINLDARTDRREQIEQTLNTVGLTAERFPAVSNPEHGGIGCAQSHACVVRSASNRGAKDLLVLEDDFEFKVGRTQLDAALTTIPRDYDVIMFDYNLQRGVLLEPTYGRVLEATSAAGYLVAGHYLNRLAACLEEGAKLYEMNPAMHWLFINDQFWKLMQKTDRWYYVVPRVGTQRDGYSDVSNNEVMHTYAL